MFTTGRIIFAVIFIIAFAIFLIWAYVKDSRLQRRYYKGTLGILAILVVIWLMFYLFIRLT